MIGGMPTPHTVFFRLGRWPSQYFVFQLFAVHLLLKRGCPGLENRVCYLFGFFFVFFAPLETAPLMAVWGIAAHLCSSKSMDTIGAVSGE